MQASPLGWSMVVLASIDCSAEPIFTFCCPFWLSGDALALAPRRVFRREGCMARFDLSCWTAVCLNYQATLRAAKVQETKAFIAQFLEQQEAARRAREARDKAEEQKRLDHWTM
eukprot:scaffold36644_cov19-Tisochrysis_lutea.AAC.1